MVAVTDHELQEAAHQEAVDQARVRGLPPPAHPRGGGGGVHHAVEQDVHVMLSGKTLAEVGGDQCWGPRCRHTHCWGARCRHTLLDMPQHEHAPLLQLVELEEGIHAQLQSGEAADPEYWSAVLDSMTLHKVCVRVKGGISLICILVKGGNFFF